MPYPALLTTTSTLPQTSTAFLATCSILSSESVTSNSITLHLPPDPSSTASISGLLMDEDRVVAMTLSPRANAAETNWFPNPDEVPVMNQMSCLGLAVLVDWLCVGMAFMVVRLLFFEGLKKSGGVRQNRLHDPPLLSKSWRLIWVYSLRRNLEFICAFSRHRHHPFNIISHHNRSPLR